MGDFESVEIPSSQDSGVNRQPVRAAMTMLVIALFAPLYGMYQNFGYSWYLSIQSILWAYNSSSGMYSGPGFMILPINMIYMFPLILLRLVPVSQIYRYYQGKTTRRRTIISLFIGDAIVLFFGLTAVLIMSFGMYLIMIPVAAQIVFGALILWRWPFREPRTPWDSVLEEKQWWEKDQESKEKKPKDEDVLW